MTRKKKDKVSKEDARKFKEISYENMAKIGQDLAFLANIMLDEHKDKKDCIKIAKKSKQIFSIYNNRAKKGKLR